MYVQNHALGLRRQFEKLAELYVNNGRPFAAQLMQKEAHDCRRLHRQAHENNRLRKARAREAQQKEHARIAKLREIGTYVHSSQFYHCAYHVFDNMRCMVSLNFR